MREPAFLCAPGLRIEAQERLSELQFAQVKGTLARIEASMERLERRLWVAVYGAVALVLAQAVLSLLNVIP